jgi:hypothetical protein
MNNTLSYLFYTNDKITTHNNNVFHIKPSQTFKFLAQDIMVCATTNCIRN